MKPKKTRGNSRKGILYEQDAQSHLVKLFPDEIVCHPWFVYKTMHKGPQWCQPDALQFDLIGGLITIYEMKLRHNTKAYKQLMHLYTPVVRKCFPRFDIKVVEMCSWYDREVKLPRKPVLAPNLNATGLHDYSIHIWRK